ncbi:MAG: AI-2E family transporter [Woeseia sp.]|nr:AI-2E family transporter [Woeseia sp.]MBT8095464.1 AI-2E family transporter [Woeseia sp.]NNE60500.1 AI-2E family transporter [Woeseia sp.]NNL54807.1 AI-2E family transporter [Woeseia sp.]
MKSDKQINWLVALAISGWLLWLLAPVLTPFVAAALLAYIGDPLADRLQGLRLPRTLAVVFVFVLTIVTIALLVLLILPLIQSQVGALIDALPGIIAQAEQVWLPRLSALIGAAPGDEIGLAAFVDRYSEMAGTWGAKILGALSRSGGALATAVISLFLIPILTFYLLRDWDYVVSHLGSLVPEKQRESVFRLAHESDEVLGAFLRGQLLVMFALAVIYSLGLSLVGLKFAIAIGVVAGLVSFVPYLGFVFGIALAGITVVLEPDPLLRLAGVVATFSIAQMIEGSILTPKLVGDRIGLHPVIVIFAVAAGGQLFGFFGVLLALPAAAVLSVLVRFTYAQYLADHPEARDMVDAPRGDP